MSRYESILPPFPIFPGSKIRLLVLDLPVWVFFLSPEEKLEKTVLIFSTFYSSVSAVTIHMHWPIHFSTIFCSSLYKVGAEHSKINPEAQQHKICIEYNENTFHIQRSSQE